MAKARSITIETRSFAKAGDATRFFSDMLARYGNGEKVSDEDALDLAALLKRHDEYDEKVGSGIACFVADRSPPPYENQRCFWIVRNDLQKVDISFHHCLKAKPYD